jgi:hypothetical protein
MYNEDLAIVKMQSSVNKEDFEELKTALRTFFHDIHQVRTAEIQPCALGDAYVRINSSLDRERFLGLVFCFGQYAMSVIKHDEEENVRSFDLDREAWVMLVGFPEELKNSASIAKAVSSFRIMVHWHEPKNLARVVVKIYLNDDAKILASVKANAGVPPKGRSWTFPYYVLKRQNVPVLQDEEAFVTTGPLHPLPPQAPRWMGPVPPVSSDATPAGSNNGSAMNVDGCNHWQQHTTPKVRMFIWLNLL